ncbi:MAG: VIT1/CCC1 transporter family protein [Vicinamibacterales bacterium]
MLESRDDQLRATHEPTSLLQLARHYLRDLVYGANDGVITTFAVVAGVTGGSLSTRAVLIVGIANLVADGLSMGVGNYLGIRSQESARKAQHLTEEEPFPVRHGVATFLAFAGAGAIPLLPYVITGPSSPFVLSMLLAFVTLFAVGAARAAVTDDRWWTAGVEMLGLGVVVMTVAYGSGMVTAALLAE